MRFNLIQYKCEIYLSLCFVFLSKFSPSLKAQKSFTAYVDSMIGAVGHVFVGASVPLGAVQLGPSNIYKGWDWCYGYHYSNSVLIGFSHTHRSGTGGSDLGDVLIMPYTGEVKVSTGTQDNPSSGFASYYSYADEVVKPGDYSVKLKNSNIKVELAATERVGFHQYSFPQGKDAHVIVDLMDGNHDKATDTYIKQTDVNTLISYRFSRGWADAQRLYFAIRSSVPIRNFKCMMTSSLWGALAARVQG